MDPTAMCQPNGTFSLLVVSAVQAMMAYQCALVDPKQWPVDRTEELAKNGFPNYDFIVIGAGAAGSVLASRLTEISTWKVLLIEAGTNPPADSEIPSMAHSMINTSIDWNFVTEVEKIACQGSIDQKCRYPKGKVVGGSSAFNSMQYVRGNKKDYDDWETAGNAGWGYETILTYFRKSMNIDDLDMKKQTEYLRYNGMGGHLNVGRFNYTDPMHEIVMTAGMQSGHKLTFDINGREQVGFTRLYGTLKDGARQSIGKAFLEPAKNRDNLHMIKEAVVTKIVFEGTPKRAVSIVVKLKNGDTKTISVTKEVLLSAGTFNSARTLLTSGIGPKAQLTKANIEVVADLAVGENFHDHVTVLVPFSWPRVLEELPDLPFIVADYMKNKRGVLAGGVETAAFIDTSKKGNGRSDIQFEASFFNSSKIQGTSLTKFGLKEEIIKGFEEFLLEKNLMLFSVTLLKPKSRGKVMLNTTEPTGNLTIQGNYLENLEDQATMVKGIEELIKLETSAIFKKNNITVDKITYAPCDSFAFKSTKYWGCIISHMSIASGHSVGTAKMGPSSDPTAVVDCRLRIHGIRNLRVIDSSIMPNITSGSNSIPKVMIAEKGADMIKEDWKFNTFQLRKCA